MGTLFVDGAQVGQGRIEETLCCRISLDETFDGAYMSVARTSVCPITCGL